LNKGVAPADVVAALQYANEKYNELNAKAGAKSKKGKAAAKSKSKSQLRLDQLTPLLSAKGREVVTFRQMDKVAKWRGLFGR
jgi:hypothetical protein